MKPPFITTIADDTLRNAYREQLIGIYNLTVACTDTAYLATLPPLTYNVFLASPTTLTFIPSNLPNINTEIKAKILEKITELGDLIEQMIIQK